MTDAVALTAASCAAGEACAWHLRQQQGGGITDAVALTLQAVLQVKLVYAIFADVGVVESQMQWH